MYLCISHAEQFNNMPKSILVPYQPRPKNLSKFKAPYQFRISSVLSLVLSFFGCWKNQNSQMFAKRSQGGKIPLKPPFAWLEEKIGCVVVGYNFKRLTALNLKISQTSPEKNQILVQASKNLTLPKNGSKIAFKTQIRRLLTFSSQKSPSPAKIANKAKKSLWLTTWLKKLPKRLKKPLKRKFHFLLVPEQKLKKIVCLRSRRCAREWWVFAKNPYSVFCSPFWRARLSVFFHAVKRNLKFLKNWHGKGSASALRKNWKSAFRLNRLKHQRGGTHSTKTSLDGFAFSCARGDPLTP